MGIQLHPMTSAQTGGAKAFPDSQWAYKLASEFSPVGCKGAVAWAE